MFRHAILAIVTALGFVGWCQAQTLTTMITNGPSSNRVDVVFVGDGYTATDLTNGVYTNHVNSYLNHMFANNINSDPFYRYRNFFNVHRVNVTSVESGADKPPLGIFRNTALDASYYYGGGVDRLLYFNDTKANAAVNTALAAASATFTPEMRLGAVNDTTYGGGGGLYGVYAGGNTFANEVALHEIGHSFGGLADEYGGNPGPFTNPEPSEVNVTKNASGAKWSRWLGYNQPTIGVIGAYEGARYFDQGIYRPSNDSKMRNLNRPFDAISREAFILRFYDFVDPLDSYTSNASQLIDPTLSVTRIDPNVINLEWFVNGNLVVGANNSLFNPRDFGFGPGTYTVSVRAYDPTGFDPINGWVRYQQSNLEQNVSWNVMLTAVPEPTTWALLGVVTVGGVAIWRKRWRAKEQQWDAEAEVVN